MLAASLTETNPIIDMMRARLTAALHPTTLEITDDSHLHRGHPGAKSGGGHFTVDITSAAFQGKTLILQHRLVYDALADLIPSKIHALALQTHSLLGN